MGRGQRTSTCGPLPFQPDKLVRWRNLTGTDCQHQPAAKDSTPFYFESQEGPRRPWEPIGRPYASSVLDSRFVLLRRKGVVIAEVPTTGVADDPVRSLQLSLGRLIRLEKQGRRTRVDEEWACVTGLDRSLSQGRIVWTVRSR